MKILRTFLILCAFAWSSLAFASVEQPASIKILLKKNAAEALLEVKGGYTIYNPYDDAKLSSGLFGKRFLVRPVKDGIKWGEVFPGIYQIKIVPDSKDTSILVDGIQYEGNLSIFKIGSIINIVNELPVESFLRSTLSSQFVYPHEEEVMSAVSIAARTMAYCHVNKNPKAYWHITKEDAEYMGSSSIIPDSTIVKAIDATRHIIMVTEENGQKVPFATTWTEHSGGKTASYQAIFRKDLASLKKGVEAPHAALDRKESKWTYAITKDQLAKKLNLKSLTNLELYVDQTSNKVYGVRLKSDRESQDCDYFEFSTKLGREAIKSNDFTIEVQDNMITFTGYGRGHGVGICLYSANSMAQNGQIASKILTKFFPDAALINLSETSAK